MESLIVFAVICALWVARINYVYWSKRRAMTPEQRAEADAEERTDMQIW
jgi:hypothetical protein